MGEKTIDSPERFTWGQMRRMVARYAEVLRRQGMGSGDYMVCACRTMMLLRAMAEADVVLQ
jgi:acyl-coenzyme A synthetase/AMP-(fatty) acid ligase